MLSCVLKEAATHSTGIGFTKTGWPGVRVLCQDQTASLIYSFYPSVTVQVQLSEQFVSWFVAYRPSNMRVYLRDGSAQTILRAATLR